LLHWRAKQAFWDVLLPALKMLAKERLLGVSLESGR